LLPQLGRNSKAWQEPIQQLRAAAETVQANRLHSVLNSHLQHTNPLVTAARLAKEGNWQSALHEVRKIPKDDANYYYALCLSGYIRAMQGDPRGSERDLESALTISKKLPEAYLNLARLCFREGRLQEASRNIVLAKACMTPEDHIEVEVQELLVFISLRQGRFWDAFRTAARLGVLRRNSPDQQIRASVIRPEALSEIAREPASLRAKALEFMGRIVCVLAGMPIDRPVFDGARSCSYPTHVPKSPLVSIRPGPVGERWSLRAAGGSKARMVFVPGSPETVRVAIDGVGSGVIHDIQLNYLGLMFSKGGTYTVEFRARAERARDMGVGIAMASEPWTNLGFYRTLTLSTDWQDFDGQFVCETSLQNGRIHFDLGESAVAVELSSFRVVDTEKRQ
jgi:tetratricopeptide (TPR) repeat protein